ncbi:MAG: NAD(P)/FAD-dependent oxidoreductase [Candidatus Delongbacteria bacterium]
MDFDIIVIGAGAVGLALAAELAPTGELLLLEREDHWGRGISSRNSEVVHGGIYYAPGSLKARLCVAGRRRIEAWAAEGRFAYRPVGKFIVATTDDERPELTALLETGRANGVEGLRAVSLDELREAEPAVQAVAALWSPSTGILDSHGFLRFLWERAQAGGAQLALRSRVVGLAPVPGGWEVEVEEGPPPDGWEDPPGPLPRRTPAAGPRQTVSARLVLNAAGLQADQIAALAGVDVEGQGLRQHWSRGEYFAPRPGAGPPLRHLVYPVPPRAGEGHLGIHVTVDLAGAVRFGPSAAWPDPPESRREDYRQDLSLRDEFARGLARYLPGVRAADLEPAGVGLRPRLRPARDFVIRAESGPGLEGLVTLLGLESPGLTSAPAIATHVAGLLRERLGA